MAMQALAGSDKRPVAGATAVGPADPNERLEVTVLVRCRDAAALDKKVRTIAADAGTEHHLTREAFARQFGADPADIDAVRAFATAHGLAVVQADAARRTVVLSGTVSQFNAAFVVKLERFEHSAGSYRGRTGPVHLPDELQGVVEAVLGLDDRPQATPHFRVLDPGAAARLVVAPAAATFLPTQLATVYDFPDGTGHGTCIGIIELGGGYRPADLQAYFKQAGVPLPKVSTVSVDHAKNQPTGQANGPDGEVMLDIEIAGAVAPAAKIVVYFAPNTDAGFLDAITTAVHDASNKPSVISISWGGPESSWTAQAMTAFDQAFQAAATMGVSVCAASGDNGSGDGVDDGANHVDFPASSPHALACGGTSLKAANGKIVSESVWNNGGNGGATGGGVSTVFALPAWQQGIKLSDGHGVRSALQKRGVPDVAGDADPQTGYAVRVDGTDAIFGGTSAVAPLWAGLIARINGVRGTSTVGYINAKLYKNAAAFNEVKTGNNGNFSAASGWDACTGLGTPDGKKISKII
jgi:kumamolisin